MVSDLQPNEVIDLLMATMRELRALDNDMTLMKAMTLLAVARQPGITQNDLGKVLNLSATATVSRNVLDWTDMTYQRRPGPDFLVQRPNPEYRRQNLVYPTTKGMAFLNKLIKTVNTVVTKKGKH